ncbi:TIGR03571 family LLM class oxidoreductase [Streptococcus sp. 121]|uniref:TIGR03571 family LLM class oxidoreductase n=1 Tax=Streptococcus sp. 121 TaxID=2797637 RepID=UPI0018F0A3B6|nr:TIGR03571 family LLM class oxidoreductase [Streptococcus sp. 121]MBJ6745869.1 TIGR03571 family LLM class oxidoreductase [Streptococcus sp. 121]
MVQENNKIHLPKFSILNKDTSSFVNSSRSKKSKDSTSRELIHPAFNKVFQQEKLTFGLIAPFKGYPDTPIPDITDLGNLANLAEQAGFSILWLRDVPLYDPNFGDVGQGLDPITLLGYLTAKTQSINLGTAGLISTLRHPIHLAKSAATTALLSGDRFILGLSAGDRPIEYPIFQQNFTDRAERFREAWDLIRTLTRKNISFPKFEGQFYNSLNGGVDFIPKVNQDLPMVSIGRSGQNISWLANEADAWIWHGVDPHTTQDIINLVKEKNHDGRWHPFGYANFVELLEDPNAPVELFHNIYLRGGSNSLANFWQEQKELGLSHITINLKPSKRPANEILQEIAENIISKVNN